MFRLINAIFLSLSLVITSFSMAVARGQNPDFGTDIVICSGVGMTTITIGPDGEPIKKTHICPDGLSIFVAIFAPVIIPVQPSAMQWRAVPVVAAFTRLLQTLSPSARGPPLVV